MLRRIVPEDDAPLDRSWLNALEYVACMSMQDETSPFFDIRDFGIVCKYERGGRPTIYEYHHIWTHRAMYADGHARLYRFVPAKDDRNNPTFVLHRDLHAGLDAVGLWDLPWKKPGMERFQMGLDWESRKLVSREAQRRLRFPDFCEDHEVDENGYCADCDVIVVPEDECQACAAEAEALRLVRATDT